MVEFLFVIINILAVIGTVYSVLQIYRTFVAVVGVLTYEKFKNTENMHQYGICIAARNEEKVIANLLDSIYNQDYPIEKLKIFVCADNCTDDTADIVREYREKNNYENLFLIEHQNPDERTKGYALRYLFEQIKEQHGIDCVDGYFVFDADNVLKQDYISRMNEAYDAGNKIVTSCRLSKNINQNWISFSYAIHWMRTCLFENKGKSFFKLACRVQGTGFLFDKELVRDGWKYTSLTEDRSFCTDAVIQGYRVSYCHDAIFYDEQPNKLKVALRQRVRWAKGHLQSTVENCPKLIRNMCRFDKSFFMSYDCYWLNFPGHVEGLARKILTYMCRFSLVLLFGMTFKDAFGSPVLAYLHGIMLEYAIRWLRDCGTALLVLFCFRKRISGLSFRKTVSGVATFFLFARIGLYTSCIALFKKVEWKPIPHETVMDMSELNK